MAVTDVRLDDKVELTLPANENDYIYILRQVAGGGFSVTDYKIKVRNLVGDTLGYPTDGDVPTPAEGTTYFNTTDKELRVYDGTIWENLINTGLEAIDEGNGDGLVKVGRTAANYGNVGLNAVDLSHSLSASTTLGATGNYSSAEGVNTEASGIYSHAEGASSRASGDRSHSEGNGSIASGEASHAEGGSTASGSRAHSEGSASLASGDFSHAGGYFTISSGKSSRAVGHYNFARSYGETAIGVFNTDYTPVSTTIFDSTDRLFVIGNGTATGSRSDALIILKNGHSAFGGTVRTKSYTVATLPTGTQGDMAFVTDATAPTYLAALTGGGSVVCPVFYNGTIWVSH